MGTGGGSPDLAAIISSSIPDPASTDPGATSADPGAVSHRRTTRHIVIACVIVVLIVIGIGTFASIRHINQGGTGKRSLPCPKDSNGKECSSNGKCLEGACSCDPGYGGADCAGGAGGTGHCPVGNAPDGRVNVPCSG